MIIFVVLGISVFVFILALLWIMVPAFFGPPSVPTNAPRIRKALQLAELKPNERLYDLGAGDGRVLLIAAREFGAQATGIEIGPIQCALIYLRALASGLGNKIKIKWANYLKADLKDADVVFLYATSKEVQKLSSHLVNVMKPGARLVSISADFPEWQPSVMDDHSLIFVYVMPPKSGNITSYMLEQVK